MHEDLGARYGTKERVNFVILVALRSMLIMADSHHAICAEQTEPLKVRTLHAKQTGICD